MTTSASFFAEISVSSPQTICIFIIYKNLFWIKASKKTFNFILKKEALVVTLHYTFTHTSRCVRLLCNNAYHNRVQHGRQRHRASAPFQPETSVTSPWKLFIMLSQRQMYRIKVLKRLFNFILKKASLHRTGYHSNTVISQPPYRTTSKHSLTLQTS